MRGDSEAKVKAALILGDGVRQICLQAESGAEEAILKMFTIDQDIQIAVKQGSIYDGGIPSVLGAMVTEARGGYHRVYQQSNAVMLILTPKPVPEPEVGPIVMPE